MTRTCNEAGLLTGEEADHVGHLLDGPDPAQGVGGLAVLQELLVVLLSQTAPLVNVRHDHARVHRVHSHSLAGQVQGCTPSETTTTSIINNNNIQDFNNGLNILIKTEVTLKIK